MGSRAGAGRKEGPALWPALKIPKAAELVARVRARKVSCIGLVGHVASAVECLAFGRVQVLEVAVDGVVDPTLMSAFGCGGFELGADAGFHLFVVEGVLMFDVAVEPGA
jgi:hypothetical protein